MKTSTRLRGIRDSEETILLISAVIFSINQRLMSEKCFYMFFPKGFLTKNFKIINLLLKK